MTYTIALAQIDSRIADLPGNVRRHAEAAERARLGGADLVVFPELSLCGYTMKDSTPECALRPGETGRVAPLIELGKEISILAGCAEESAGFAVYNSAFLFEDGAVTPVHRKVYPPTYGMFEEMRHFQRGGRVRAARSRLGALGVLVCEDLWHLPLPYLLAQEGAQVIICMAASPTRLSGDDARLRQARLNSEQHRSYARLLSAYVVYCNRVGYEDGVNFWGGSEVIGPQGDPIVQAKLFDEDLVFAEIDPEEVRRARRQSRHFLEDDPELFVREAARILRLRSE